jgi:hypothetical protein
LRIVEVLFCAFDGSEKNKGNSLQELPLEADPIRLPAKPRVPQEHEKKTIPHIHPITFGLIRPHSI